MRAISLRILIVIQLIFLANRGITGVLPSTDSHTDDVNVHQWVEQHFAKGKIPPFSFVLDGQKSDDFILSWQYAG